MVAAFTAASSDRQVQGIAYSLDKGRTFTKYDKNPVINSKEKWNSQDTRDPKVFWYAALQALGTGTERARRTLHLYLFQSQRLEIREPCYRLLGMSRIVRTAG